MIEHLKNIYSDSLLNPDRKFLENTEDYYLVQEKTESLLIPIENLNEKEIRLLDLLLDKKSIETEEPTSLEILLTKGVLDPAIEYEEGQLVYLHVNHLHKNNIHLWKETLKDSMSEIIDIYSASDQLIILLLDGKNNEKKQARKLEEVTQSLDQDFNLLTQGMLGQITYFNRQIQDVFTFEKKIFTSYIKRRKLEGIVSLSEVLINEVARMLKEKNPELPRLTNYLIDKGEMKELIYLLFKNQGNLSQTAEELFIHRNTLSYRMKQFQEGTGFDLNYFPDLILTYFLID